MQRNVTALKWKPLLTVRLFTHSTATAAKNIGHTCAAYALCLTRVTHGKELFFVVWIFSALPSHRRAQMVTLTLEFFCTPTQNVKPLPFRSLTCCLPDLDGDERLAGTSRDWHTAWRMRWLSMTASLHDCEECESCHNSHRRKSFSGGKKPSHLRNALLARADS